MKFSGSMKTMGVAHAKRELLEEIESLNRLYFTDL
jgi:hypothetical protein